MFDRRASPEPLLNFLDVAKLCKLPETPRDVVQIAAGTIHEFGWAQRAAGQLHQNSQPPRVRQGSCDSRADRQTH